MKKITPEELEVFLRKHKLWLECNPGGERADLCEADLRGADLCGANLREANLYGANLYGANLREANLREANLCEANLRGVDFRGADLYGANLCEADLYGADLYGADFRGADLYGANLAIACPEKGSFIAFKKASNHIVELLIPDDALRSSATSRKCRCSKAQVLSITNLDGSDADVDFVKSSYDKSFIYWVGDIVEVVDFDTDRWNECAPGIHFFITRQEAVEY